jgi:hypothetical protein
MENHTTPPAAQGPMTALQLANRFKRGCQIALCVIAAAYGAFPELRSQTFGQYTPFDVVFLFALTACVYLWFRFDAVQWGYRPGLWMKILVALTLWMGLALYFFRSRDRSRALPALGRMFLFMLLLLTLRAVGWVVGNLMDGVADQLR